MTFPAWMTELWERVTALHVTTPSAATALAWTLLHFLWQGALVALVLNFVLRVARKATTQYALCLGALGLMAIMPPMTMVLIYDTNGAAVAPSSDATAAVAAGADSLLALLAGGADESSLSVASSSASGDAWSRWVVLAWFAGVGLFGVRLLFDLGQVFYLRSGRAPFPAEVISRQQKLLDRMGFGSARVLFVSERVRDAVAIGFWRPCVLLPASWLAELTPEMLEAVIAHELAHIRRFDLWIRLFQRVIEAGLFYHPAVWRVSRKLREASELCCDEWAIARTGRRVAYVETLQHLAAARLAANETPLLRPALLATMGDKPMKLFERINYLLGGGEVRRRTSRRVSLWRSAATLFVLSTGLITTATCLAAVAQDAPPRPEQDSAQDAKQKARDEAQAAEKQAARAAEQARQELEAAMALLEKQLGDAKQQGAQQQDAQKQTVEQALNAAMRQLEKELAGLDKKLEQELGGQSKEMAHEMESVLKAIEQELAGLDQDVAKELKDAGGEINTVLRQLEKELAGLDVQLNDTLSKELEQKLKVDLGAKMEALRQELDKSAVEMQKVLETQLKQLDVELSTELKLNELPETVRQELEKAQVNQQAIQEKMQAKIQAELEERIAVQQRDTAEAARRMAEAALQERKAVGKNAAEMQELAAAKQRAAADEAQRVAEKIRAELAAREAKLSAARKGDKDQADGDKAQAERAAVRAQLEKRVREMIERAKAEGGALNEEQRQAVLEQVERAKAQMKQAMPNAEAMKQLIEQARQSGAAAKMSEEQVKVLKEQIERAKARMKDGNFSQEAIQKLIEESRKKAMRSIPDEAALKALIERARTADGASKLSEEQTRMIRELLEKARANAGNSAELREKIDAEMEAALKQAKEALKKAREKKARDGDQQDGDNEDAPPKPAGVAVLAA